jgi:hypothetical protein
MKRIGALATVAALALGSIPVLAQAPPASAQGRAPAAGQAPPVSLDIRAGEYPAGDPSGVGQIKPGDGATFSVSVYEAGKNKPKTFSSLANELGTFHFVLYYGWGQTGVTVENGCTGIAQHDTSFCYSQSSQTYHPPSLQNPASTSSTWAPTTDVKAPTTDLSTLFYAIVLEVGNKQLLWSEAGNVEYNLTAKQVFLSSTWGTGAQLVSSGTKVHMTACITDGDCQNGLVRAGNFLGDYLYVCNSWPPFGSGGVPITKDLPPNGQLYTSGKADQVLGGIEQKFTPPPGQDWSVFYYAFASSHSSLAKESPVICPTSPAEVDAGKLTGITTDFATLMITWQGPNAAPPSVSLTASSTHPPANQSVSFVATATNPDGNSYLYICARSGTSWLSLSPPDSNGYLGAAPVSTPVPKTLGTAVAASGRSGTAQFVAFLSTDPVHPGSCPVPGTDSAAYGTLAPSEWTAQAGPWHASYDYSAVVNVTWPPSPPSPSSGQAPLSLSLSAFPIGSNSPLAGPTVADVGQTVDLEPNVVGIVPKKYAKVYVCARSGTGPWLRLSGHSSARDHYAVVDPVPETTYTSGFALGTAPGRATFVAFVSTRTSPPGPQCPLASTASAKWGTGSKADFSAPVTVTWEGHAHTKPPQVSLTASPTDPGFGQPSVVTATYTNPGSADALYICYPGSHPWLQTDYNRPYLDEEPLPSLGQTAGYAVGTPGASGGSAQFVAFLSSKSSPPATCPLTDALGPEWGTTSAADYSNRISVTWPGPPAGRSTVTLSASPANPGAGQRTTFTASYSHPGRANAVYICQLTGPGDITLSGKRPYLAADGVRPGATTGLARGWAKAPGGTNASFIAYLSTEVGQEGSGSCPTAPGRHGAIAISTPVTVSWGSAPPVVAGAGPIVSITVSANQVRNGTPVTITASYQDPGQARALYITDDGVVPPNFNFMFGSLEQWATGVDPPVKHLPYLAAHPVPTFPDAAATVSGTNETVQFGAFLSTLDGLQAGPTIRSGQQDAVPSPGPGVVSPTFGTTTPADFSPVVDATWGAPSQGTTITLQASTTKPQHAGDKVVFTATATGMPAGDYLYVCAVPGGSGSLATEKTGNFLAGPTQSPVASGWASGAGTSADFIAFDSPNPGWGWCPSAPYNWPPAPGTGTWYIPTVSNVVSVSWPAGPKHVQWWPT